jgi:hypothetical protein
VGPERKIVVAAKVSKAAGFLGPNKMPWKEGSVSCKVPEVKGDNW